MQTLREGVTSSGPLSMWLVPGSLQYYPGCQEDPGLQGPCASLVCACSLCFLVSALKSTSGPDLVLSLVLLKGDLAQLLNPVAFSDPWFSWDAHQPLEGLGVQLWPGCEALDGWPEGGTQVTPSVLANLPATARCRAQLKAMLLQGQAISPGVALVQDCPSRGC